MLVDYNDRKNAPFSNENIRQAVSRVMSGMEEGKRDAKRNANNLTMDTLSNHSTISPSQGEISNLKIVHLAILPSQGDILSVTSKRRISSSIMAEMINIFNELTIQ